MSMETPEMLGRALAEMHEIKSQIGAWGNIGEELLVIDQLITGVMNGSLDSGVALEEARGIFNSKNMR